MQYQHEVPQTLTFSDSTNLLEQSAYKYQLQDREEPNLYRHLFDYESVPKVSFNHRFCTYLHAQGDLDNGYHLPRRSAVDLAIYGRADCTSV